MSDHTTATPTSERRGRRGLVVLVVAALVVLLVGGGAFAAWRMLSGGGPRPAEVLPAGTLGMVSLDLDPSGQQKIEAIQTLRKFPSFREDVGLEEDDDVLQVVFEELQEQDDVCPEVDYAEDVAPWVGERFAVAAVELDDAPVPAVVVQVSDREAAEAGVEALASCAGEETGGESGGVVVGEDYVVLSDTQDHAEQVAAAGEESSLSDDEDYQRWTEEAGGEGIVSMYAAPAAAELLAETLAEEGVAEAEQLEEQLDAFQGAAAQLRFDDGGVVLSAAAGSADTYEGASVGEYVGQLPADTAATFALAVPEESEERLRELAEDPGAGPEGDAIGLLAGSLSSVGLDFPDDLITVLGEAVSVSLGGEAPASLSSPAEVPLGLLVHGDAEGIEEVVGKVEAAAGVSLEQLPAYLERNDDRVALSTQESYAQELLEEGSLADDPEFQAVVAEADDAQAVLFAELNDSWRELAVASADDPAVEENLAVLSAFGLSVWTDGEVGHLEARLALN